MKSLLKFNKIYVANCKDFQQQIADYRRKIVIYQESIKNLKQLRSEEKGQNIFVHSCLNNDYKELLEQTLEKFDE